MGLTVNFMSANINTFLEKNKIFTILLLTIYDLNAETRRKPPDPPRGSVEKPFSWVHFKLSLVWRMSPRPAGTILD
jgi:hypothetical protein